MVTDHLRSVMIIQAVQISLRALRLEDTVGFEHVDAHVTDVIITWIGDVLEHKCKQLLGVKRRFEWEHNLQSRQRHTCPWPWWL